MTLINSSVTRGNIIFLIVHDKMFHEKIVVLWTQVELAAYVTCHMRK